MHLTVGPEGPLNATIALVGESPGRDELVEGRPFVGAAGQRLNALLNEAHILRARCRILNVMDTRPPGDKFGHFWLDNKMTKPTEQLVLGTRQLYECLADMPYLRVVVALGRQPMYVLTKSDGITKQRGSILQTYSASVSWCTHYAPIVLPTFHPSFCLRNWAVNPLVVHDLRLAKQIADGEGGPLSILPDRDLDCYPNDGAICAYLDLIYHDRPLSVDIECWQGRISRISMSQDPLHAISIPFVNLDTEEWLPDRQWIWNKLRDLFLNQPIIGQNFGTFDLPWLRERQGIEIRNLVHDTMIAQHSILPGMPKFLKPLSLAMLTSLYTNEPYYKDEGKVLGGRKPNDEQYGKYSAKDAAVTYEVYQEQISNPLFTKRRHTFEHEMRLVNGPIRYMMQRGVKVDTGLKKQLRERAVRELTLLELLVKKDIGKDINLRSPQQIGKLLYDDMRLPAPKSRSTDEDSIKVLQAKFHKVEVLNYILQYRGIEQVRKNILSAKVDPDGRMRCSYSPTTDFGRFKSYENPFGSGCNMQNVPRDPNIRRMFTADDGCVMIEADLEQAELRDVAYWSGDPTLLRLLNEEGGDVHTEMAKMILDKDTINSLERQLGKTIVHAVDLMQSARGVVKSCRLKLGLDMKETEARQLINRYLSRFPCIKSVFHEGVKAELANNKRTLVNPFGREITFHDRWGNELFRRGAAFLMQSTIGDLLNTILMLWWNGHCRVGELLMQLHDALYVQCHESTLDGCLSLLAIAFSYTFPMRSLSGIDYPEVFIPVKFKVSRRWGEKPLATYTLRECGGELIKEEKR